jgi:sulfoxide reductase heme-binding subunit YedZ
MAAGLSLPALPRRFHAASVWALYIIGLCPAAWHFYLGASGQLGPNPVKDFEHLLGIWGLRFLIATLAITPLRDFTGINWIRYRRALGLLAFYYVVMHFATYMLLDKRLDMASIIADIARRPYITIGMACLVLLVPLAVTSNNLSIRKLGKNWVRLHKLVYLIILGGALHYSMAVKSITLGPFIHMALPVLLVTYRLVRPRVMAFKKRKNGATTARAVRQ